MSTHTLFTCLHYTLFFSIESKWRKEVFYSLVVCKCAYERMKCDFLHRPCAQCRYTDMDVDTHTHTQYVIHKIWLQLLFWLHFVCRLLIFLRNGCGWFDSHLLLSVDNIPATGYNGSVILGKLQLLRIIRAAILIAAFYSYTKRCDAHTQQKKWKIESSRVDGYYWICHQVLMQNFNIIAPYSGGNFQYLHANQSFGTQQNIFSLFHIEFE